MMMAWNMAAMVVIASVAISPIWSWKRRTIARRTCMLREAKKRCQTHETSQNVVADARVRDEVVAVLACVLGALSVRRLAERRELLVTVGATNDRVDLLDVLLAQLTLLPVVDERVGRLRDALGVDALADEATLGCEGAQECESVQYGDRRRKKNARSVTATQKSAEVWRF